jgi:MoxR-like ATPase
MPNGLDELKDTLVQVRAEVAKVIIGQDDAVTSALVAIFTNQHALIEGVPGIAKTLLVRTLAAVLGCDFGRIQFTPDLMPSDITGTNVFDFNRHEFTLVKGPIFTTFLLADEINRAPAKTQAALLQAMQERHVTIDRQTLPLDPSFTVFATQNPIEYEGTYPLPEAQKDRFMLKIRMDCPQREHELALAGRMLGDDSPEAALARGEVKTVLPPGRLTELRPALQTVLVRPELLGYLVDIVRATRSHESILVGAGPRATQAILLGARAQAALAGRDYATPDDVATVARPVLEHRLVLRPEFEIEGLSMDEVIDSVLRQVAVPR